MLGRRTVFIYQMKYISCLLMPSLQNIFSEYWLCFLFTSSVQLLIVPVQHILITMIASSFVMLPTSDVLKISDFGLSKVLHADDYTHIPMGRAVPTHHGPLDAKFSGKPSAKRRIVIKIACHMTDLRLYLRYCSPARVMHIAYHPYFLAKNSSLFIPFTVSWFTCID